MARMGLDTNAVVQDLSHKLEKYAAVARFASVLGAGLCLAILFRGARRYYVHHLIFALHYVSFANLLSVFYALAFIGLRRIHVSPGRLNRTSYLVLFVYAFLAMRTVYRQPRAATALKAAVFVAVDLALFVAAVVIAASVAAVVVMLPFIAKLDLRLEDVLDGLRVGILVPGRARQAEVLLAHSPVARDDERHRQPEQRPVGVVDLVLLLVAVEHRVVHLHLLGVRLRVLELVEQDHADHLEALRLVLVVERDEAGDLDLAGPAPGRPEIEQHDLALVVGEADLLAGEVLEREVEVRRLRVRRTRCRVQHLRGPCLAAAARRGQGHDRHSRRRPSRSDQETAPPLSS